MNLVELIIKKDVNIVVQKWDEANFTWATHDDATELLMKFKGELKLNDSDPQTRSELIFRGLKLAGGFRIVVKSASNYWPGFAEGNGNFYFKTLKGKSTKIKLSWSASDVEDLSSVKLVEIDQSLQTVRVPNAGNTEEAKQLIITVIPNQESQVFFGVHYVLDRNIVYQECIGTGVELGPGPKPQILPSENVSVKYLEQAAPEEWVKLYEKESAVEIRQELWNNYIQGDAKKIPVDDGSLDFIFSSHVLEHLANPFQHLKYWSTLLKKGGKTVAVIPDAKCCKDYVFKLSTYDELIKELDIGDMDPTYDHYKRWGKFRMPKVSTEELMESKRSIHVHFYTAHSMTKLMTKGHKELGYDSFKLVHSDNYKDFYLILSK